MIAAMDFGASATKAAVYPGSGTALPVRIDGAAESSSSVFLDRGGRLICGQAAENSGRKQPARMRGALKRRINRPDAVEPVHQEVDFDATVFLPLVRCVATVIGHAWAAILKQTGGKAVPLLLTHPVGWGEPQRAALLEAARLAGVEPAGMLTEAEAVGWNVCAELRPQGPLLVVDLGASTLDIALLDVRSPQRIEVLHSDGDNYIGGDDFDRGVIEIVAAALSDDPADADLLAQFHELCETLPHVAAREAERVKLTLATQDSAVFAHGDHLAVEVGQDDFLDATSHLVDRITDRVRRAMEHSGIEPKTMVVSGGAARLPSIRDSLAELAEGGGVTLLDWADDGLPGTPTTAVALGAARMPRPWTGATALATRPAFLEERLIAPETDVVAVAGALVTRERNWSAEGGQALLRRNPDRSFGSRLAVGQGGVDVVAYDPSADQLVIASPHKTVSLWRLHGDRAPIFAGSHWRARLQPPAETGSVTAVAARGRLAAWTESAGPGAIVAAPGYWRTFRPGFPVRWLRFTAGPYLIAAADDRLVLIDPMTGRDLDTLALTEPIPHTAVAVSADDALVFTACGTELRCHRCEGGRFVPGWKSSAFAVPAIAAARVGARPTLVVFDATRKVYRALDARTGEQFALKDAASAEAPTELLADGNTGVVYPRHEDGRLSVLTFAGERR